MEAALAQAKVRAERALGGSSAHHPLHTPTLPLHTLAITPIQVRITHLESSLITKGKEVEGLQRMLDSARLAAHHPQPGGEGDGGREGREGDKSEAVGRLEAELAATRSRLVHVEHVSRSR